MKTGELEEHFRRRNEAVEKVKQAVLHLQDMERSLCIALVQDKEDQVRNEIGDDDDPSDWHKGQLAMARRCTVSLEHSRTWDSPRD